MPLITAVLPHMDLKGSCMNNVTIRQCLKTEVFQSGVFSRNVNQLRRCLYFGARFQKSSVRRPSIKMVANGYLGTIRVTIKFTKGWIYVQSFALQKVRSLVQLSNSLVVPLLEQSLKLLIGNGLSLLLVKSIIVTVERT